MRRILSKPQLNAAFPYLFLLLEALIFHGRALFTSAYRIPFDLREYHLPLSFFLSENLGMGRLPLWDPYIYCGFPFYANIHAQIFYPLAWPIYALANIIGLDSLSKLLEWGVALHVFLGGAFAYLLLRKLNLSRGSAVFGASVFELGAFFASQTQHIEFIAAGCWLPLAWYGVLALGEGFSWRRLGLLTGTIGLSLLGGSPTVTFIVAGSAGIFAVLLIVFRRAPARVLVYIAAACVWGALLAAVQLLPTMTLTPLSTAALRGEWHIEHGIPWQGMVSLIAPNYFHVFNPRRYSLYNLPHNITYMYVYCGMFGLGLAVAAGFFSRHKFRIVLLLTTILCGMWMMSSYLPLIGKYYPLLPGSYRAVVYPELALAAFSLGIAALAALGAERLVAPRGRIAMGALILLSAVDLTAWSSGRYMNTAKTKDEPGVTPFQIDGSAESLSVMRGLTDRSYPRDRIDVIRDSKNWTSSAQITHIPTASGEEPMVLHRIVQMRLALSDGYPWERYFLVSKPDSKLLDIMNVRYLLAYSFWDRVEVRTPKVPLVETIANHFVYENLDVQPRFHLVGKVRRTRDFTESLAVMKSTEFDPAQEAVVEGEGELNIPSGAQGKSEVRALHYSPHRVELAVESQAPAFLVTAETWYPGWRVEVNGREERIWMTNGAFRGFTVPAGKSRVTMLFQPRDILYGASISVVAWALLLWAIRTGGRRRDRVPKP